MNIPVIRPNSNARPGLLRTPQMNLPPMPPMNFPPQMPPQMHPGMNQFHYPPPLLHPQQQPNQMYPQYNPQMNMPPIPLLPYYYTTNYVINRTVPVVSTPDEIMIQDTNDEETNSNGNNNNDKITENNNKSNDNNSKKENKNENKQTKSTKNKAKQNNVVESMDLTITRTTLVKPVDQIAQNNELNDPKSPKTNNNETPVPASFQHTEFHYFHIIPHKCYPLIFAQIPLLEQIVLRRVSSHWKFLLESFFSKQKTLKLFSSVQQLAEYKSKIEAAFNEESDPLLLLKHEIQEVLIVPDRYFGSRLCYQLGTLFPNVEHLFVRFDLRASFREIPFLLNLLVNLREIHFCGDIHFRDDPPKLNLIRNSLPYLKRLDFLTTNFFHTPDTSSIPVDLSLLMPKNLYCLSRFSLVDYEEDIVSILGLLGPKLTHLTLDWDCFPTRDELKLCIAVNPCLRDSLTNLELINVKNEDIFALLRNFEKLDSLTVHFESNNVKLSHLIYDLSKLEYLTTLHLNNIQIDLEVDSDPKETSAFKNVTVKVLKISGIHFEICQIPLNGVLLENITSNAPTTNGNSTTDDCEEGEITPKQDSNTQFLKSLKAQNTKLEYKFCRILENYFPRVEEIHVKFLPETWFGKIEDNLPMFRCFKKCYLYGFTGFLTVAKNDK